LEDYVIRCLTDTGEECALLFLDAFDDKVFYLENSPPIGCPRLKRGPLKYRVLSYWLHLWLVA